MRNNRRRSQMSRRGQAKENNEAEAEVTPPKSARAARAELREARIAAAALADVKAEEEAVKADVVERALVLVPIKVEAKAAEQKEAQGALICELIVKTAFGPCWRTLLVPASYTLFELSGVLQHALGWHIPTGQHSFLTALGEFAFYDNDADEPIPGPAFRSSRKITLQEVAASQRAFVCRCHIFEAQCKVLKMEASAHQKADQVVVADGTGMPPSFGRRKGGAFDLNQVSAAVNGFVAHIERLKLARPRAEAAKQYLAQHLDAIPPAQYELVLRLHLLRWNVWRRVVVPETLRLRQLHLVFQAAMEFDDCHLYTLNFDGLGYSAWKGATNDNKYLVCELLDPEQPFLYTYDDFRDMHFEVTVEEVLRIEGEAKPNRFPTCTGGSAQIVPDDHPITQERQFDKNEATLHIRRVLEREMHRHAENPKAMQPVMYQTAEKLVPVQQWVFNV